MTERSPQVIYRNGPALQTTCIYPTRLEDEQRRRWRRRTAFIVATARRAGLSGRDHIGPDCAS